MNPSLKIARFLLVGDIFVNGDVIVGVHPCPEETYWWGGYVVRVWFVTPDGKLMRQDLNSTDRFTVLE